MVIGIDNNETIGSTNFWVYSTCLRGTATYPEKQKEDGYTFMVAQKERKHGAR